jgi:hypothetical protein
VTYGTTKVVPFQKSTSTTGCYGDPTHSAKNAEWMGHAAFRANWRKHPSWAKARRFLSATYGTTEVVPFQNLTFTTGCYGYPTHSAKNAEWMGHAAFRANWRKHPSWAKARRFLSVTYGTTKVVPFQNLTFTTGCYGYPTHSAKSAEWMGHPTVTRYVRVSWGRESQLSRINARPVAKAIFIADFHSWDPRPMLPLLAGFRGT